MPKTRSYTNCVRSSGDQLKSGLTEGRFDEASQRDVLALAARLQKEHLETMSAAEIEQAAIEGGMNGCRIAANLLMPRMKMMAAKDFFWLKTETGVTHGIPD